MSHVDILVVIINKTNNNDKNISSSQPDGALIDPIDKSWCILVNAKS